MKKIAALLFVAASVRYWPAATPSRAWARTCKRPVRPSKTLRSKHAMQKFNVHKGLVAPMDRENVDTDAIIPKQFLKSIRKTGFGPNLFDEWRYLDAGFPGQDPASRKPNPDFVLNQPRYAGASHPAGAQELRLRLLARTRAVGARPIRLSRHHRAELRRHLLQQLLQERPAADRAAGGHRGPVVRRGAMPSPATSSPSTWSAR